ncbi:MAG: GNAT family N-acetyltransferase [Blastochloris sp.]|nr:GNAT family N-acetyltransferase [Blastochloris sp.]
MVIVFRTARRSDARYVLGLEEACMRTYAEALWGHWHPSDIPATFCVGGCRIIECDGVAVGCVQVSHHGDHLWIDKLYIDPDHQNRGLGGLALRYVLDAAAQEQLPVKLCVLITNPAQAFYERAGFVVCEESPERRIMTTSRLKLSPAPVDTQQAARV